MKNTEQIADYCGQTVEILSLDQNDLGIAATILFEDGREDEVPYKSLKFN